MKKEYKFSGGYSGKSKVLLEDDKITISRKGILAILRYGLKGQKIIWLKNISGIQYKPSGITTGYLQFIVTGSQENKNGLRAAMKDENTVCFWTKRENLRAEEIKKYIEEYNTAQFRETVNQDDKYDKLKKIKELLDCGALSQLEYDEEKQKILQ